MPPLMNARAILGVALLSTTLLSGCQVMANSPPQEMLDERGRVVARWVKAGTDGQGCQLYRRVSLSEDHVPDASLWYWDGKSFTVSSEKCTNHRGKALDD
ncbi:hypothetical protein GCM10007160_27640 [Litchfieldella qijiaojingensis]|uniref:Lipoprotein n=1 Tax=Litchfieldella qijiaojingensis TaxID=980347 RepID=A0ABQ2YZR5_9GAMM|nr:hypothetical protein [Halomonas qijiaojingensis]GGX98567.1 hypothetical protein GCM10007160_27640 [Halomonas qijiaojingensis]